MDYPPREIIAALRAGMLERVLRSNTIWLCASCYSCYVRCPSGIKITDMMYELKRLAIDYDLVPKDAKAPVMAKLFVDMVDKNGRTAELPLVSSYMLKTDPLGAVKMLPRAIKMFRHGRMSFTSHKIKGVSDLRKFTGTINEEFAPTQQRSTAMGEAN